jgi:hypothetical protein
LADALNPLFVTTNGRRPRITKREAVIAQPINESASADLRATRMLTDMLKDIEKKAGVVGGHSADNRSVQGVPGQGAETTTAEHEQGAATLRT